jgi:hypothetical protein
VFLCLWFVFCEISEVVVREEGCVSRIVCTHVNQHHKTNATHLVVVQLWGPPCGTTIKGGGPPFPFFSPDLGDGGGSSRMASNGGLLGASRGGIWRMRHWMPLRRAERSAKLFLGVFICVCVY